MADEFDSVYRRLGSATPGNSQPDVPAELRHLRPGNPQPEWGSTSHLGYKPCTLPAAPGTQPRPPTHVTDVTGQTGGSSIQDPLLNVLSVLRSP